MQWFQKALTMFVRLILLMWNDVQKIDGKTPFVGQNSQTDKQYYFQLFQLCNNDWVEVIVSGNAYNHDNIDVIFPWNGVSKICYILYYHTMKYHSSSWLNTKKFSHWFFVGFHFIYRLDLLELYLGRIQCYDLAGDQIFWFYETPKLPLITLVFKYVCHCVVPKGTKSK